MSNVNINNLSQNDLREQCFEFLKKQRIDCTIDNSITQNVVIYEEKNNPTKDTVFNHGGVRYINLDALIIVGNETYLERNVNEISAKKYLPRKLFRRTPAPTKMTVVWFNAYKIRPVRVNNIPVFIGDGPTGSWCLTDITIPFAVDMGENPNSKEPYIDFWHRYLVDGLETHHADDGGTVIYLKNTDLIPQDVINNMIGQISLVGKHYNSILESIDYVREEVTKIIANSSLNSKYGIITGDIFVRYAENSREIVDQIFGVVASKRYYEELMRAADLEAIESETSFQNEVKKFTDSHRNVSKQS